MPASEHHFVHRVGWLRAAVLGANDGIVSTGSLIVGVASATTDQHSVLVAGVAGLVAGALSMAAGEYVSVSSQADTERADLETERRALDESPKDELRELAAIYVNRGVEPKLAMQVATQLTEYDDLGAHARDELGMSDEQTARPVQAALTSAATFSCGALLPLLASMFAMVDQVVPVVAGASLLSLTLLGVISARAGGAGTLKATLRITLWGAAAMALTALVGSIFGTVI
ncbi:MAG: VIT family protein [Proteobacteria bacterium]|jgi:VIT1/CCC1 family predicted Fe2+/Mn2+ transporter|nr:VIT family protein [Pseudomonadota bacterium]MDA1298629.1 VIT family protein [Pseudomonadota bacterium]